jgi:hypothetical protein
MWRLLRACVALAALQGHLPADVRDAKRVRVGLAANPRASVVGGSGRILAGCSGLATGRLFFFMEPVDNVLATQADRSAATRAEGAKGRAALRGWGRGAADS